MADTEFRAPSREPTFVRPLDASSRRRPHTSRDSAAASTRSWVLMNQQTPPPPVEPIPIPEPVPALASRPLPEPPQQVDESESEHMAVHLPSADGLGYQWTAGRTAKARDGKGFVGGFVTGLRRLPRAFVRTRRPRRGTTGTEGTEETEGTGMTGNTLPRYVSTPPTPEVAEASVAFVRTQGALAAGGNDAEDRRPRHPSLRGMPPPDVQQGVTAPIVSDPTHGDGDMPGGLDFPPAPLENPYDHGTTSRHGDVPSAASPHLGRTDDRLAPPTDVDGDEPVSVHAHPAPTQDYRRMSTQGETHPHTHTTIPSAPLSTDSPSFSSELNGFHRFFNALHLMPWVTTDRLVVDYPPRTKPTLGPSWYLPAGSAPADPPPPAASHADESPRSPPRHRSHRRATTAGDTPPLLTTLTSYPAFSPLLPPPPTSGSGRRPPAAHGHTPQRSARAHRHHRRSATYHGPAAWTPPPMSMLPAPPAPVYIIHPAPTATPDAGSASSTPVAQMLAPVYMQIQMHSGRGSQLAFVHGASGYAYAYASPIAMPAPAQTVQ